MTGVIRDISIAPDETKTVQMVIERAVARVDVFIEAIDGGAVTGYIAGSTSVIGIPVAEIICPSLFSMLEIS